MASMYVCKYMVYGVDVSIWYMVSINVSIRYMASMYVCMYTVYGVDVCM